MSSRSIAVTLAVALISGGALPAAQDPSEAAPDYAALGREIVRLVHDNFLDPERASEWARRYADYAAEVRDAETFASRTNEVLGRLETSHTRYYPRQSAGYWALLAIFHQSLGVGRVEYDSIGVDLDDRHHVRRVLAAGPADQAGILRGDRILELDGRPFAPLGAFEGRAGSPVRVTIQRQTDSPPFEITVTPQRVNPLEEWLAAQRAGVRVFPRSGVDVAYIPLLWCAGDEADTLMQELLAVRFKEADALILDFRDGWGGCNPNFLDYFNTAPPVLTLIDRDGERREFDPHWRKPLVLLINGGSRSGKEVVAHAVQRRKIGTLVGQRTAGFVVGGKPFVLSDGSVLYLAVMDALVDGERLEGVGVAPDIPVPDQLEYAAGVDPQLERAIGALVERTPIQEKD